jgi:peroxiredoxin
MRSVLTLLFATVSIFLQAQGYGVGAKVADFGRLANLNAQLSGLADKVGLADYATAKGVIVVFTCNHCPYAIKYEDRMIALHREFAAKGYPVLAINPNDPVQYPDDAPAEMTVRAEEKQFPFAYVFDETQQVAKTFGATRTPHVYLLQRKGKKFFVRYIGSIDDDPEGANIKSTFLADALNALLAQKPVEVPTTKALGCSIKWKK